MPILSTRSSVYSFIYLFIYLFICGLFMDSEAQSAVVILLVTYSLEEATEP
jgi:NADH:ubiquinone oxidoreductase subunit 6 (subunit J)